MIRSVVTAPVALVLLPIRLVRSIARMRLSTVLAVATGGAAAFTAARRLMARDDAVNELPEALQEPAARAQSALTSWRGRLRQAMAEAHEAEAEAADELEQDYLRRSGRASD